MKQIETIDRQGFAPYGTLLEFTEVQPATRFEILVSEPDAPWRLALFRVIDQECGRLECHPASMESFEPVRGTGVLLVAPPQAPQEWRAFLLDRPVCLHKGVWHAMLTFSEETVVKITENLTVGSEFFEFKHPIRVGADGEGE